MEKFVGFEQDINNLIYSFESNVLTGNDLELLKTSENKRTNYAIKTSDSIKKELENVFALYDKVVDSLSKNLKVPSDTLQAVFQYISRVMISISNFDKVIKSSSLTISSSIIAAESAISSALEQDMTPDLSKLLEGLVNLEIEQKRKDDLNDDDDDSSKSLFYKKKKEIGTQTPFNPVSQSNQYDAFAHSNTSMSGQQIIPAQVGSTGMSVSGVGSDKRKNSVLGGQGFGSFGNNRPSSPNHKASEKEMSMSLRETKYGIPGEPKKSNFNQDNNQNVNNNENNSSKQQTKKSLKGFLSKFKETEADSTHPNKANLLLGNLDVNTIADIEDKVSNKFHIYI